MILLATDLDRTLLPNGPAPDDGSSAVLFSALAAVPHTLAYVTGRNLTMVRDAQEKYGIPTPDYLIAEVGTRIYRKEADELVDDTRWVAYVEAHEPAWDRDRIVKAVGTPSGLYLQEPEVQNRFKISYYLPADANKDATLTQVHQALESIGTAADVLYSFDPLKDNIGLVDILPKTATKATALEFLRAQEQLAKNEVVYCGDSGNDILPLTSCYRSILVNNAPQEIKDTVAEKVAASTCPDSLYIATGADDTSGNYAAGILEGLHHFGLIAM